tara:strand:- start:506 stop:712 length:207 start_codon:yes stop_codon:yes gene_type:complete
MAHLIRLTDYQTGEKVLYNLDTVVSIERVKDATVITTRWGRNQVVESLEYIEQAARGKNIDESSPSQF